MRAEVLLILLVLGLAACDGYADPYAQIAAGNAALQATRAADIQLQKEQVRAAASATQSVMETDTADRAAINRMNAVAQATLTGLDQQAAAITIGALAASETRTAAEYALRKCGVTVFQMDKSAGFDLLCAKDGKLFVIEVKAAGKYEFTPDEMNVRQTLSWAEVPYCVVQSIEDALKLWGLG